MTEEIEHVLSEQDAAALTEKMDSVTLYHKAKIKLIQEKKWYKRRNVAIVSILLLLVFALTYFESITMNKVPDILSLNLQFYILSVSLIMFFLTYIRSYFEKISKKHEEIYANEMAELKQNTSSMDYIFESVREIHDRFNKKYARTHTFHLIISVSIGLVLAFVSFELIESINKSNYLLASIVILMLLILVPFTVNEFFKNYELLKVARAQRKEYDKLIDLSINHLKNKPENKQTP